MLRETVIAFAPLAFSGLLIVMGIVIMAGASPRGTTARRKGSWAKAMAWTVGTFTLVFMLDSWIGRYSFNSFFPSKSEQPNLRLADSEIQVNPAATVAQDN